MVTTLGNLDVCGISGRGQDPRRCFIVKVVWQVSDSAIPRIPCEASLLSSVIALRPRSQNIEGTRIQNRRRCYSGSRKNALQLARADHGVYFRNVLENLPTKPLDQTAGNDQFFCLTAMLQLCHFEDRIDRLLLCRPYK